MATRKTNKERQIKEKKPFSLYSFESQNYNMDESWIDKIPWSLGIKVAFNVLFIVEVLSAQLIVINDMTTTEVMQCEIHRYLAKLISNPDISTIFNVFAVFDTSQYSDAILDDEMVARTEDLSSPRKQGQAQFKGIDPWPGMPVELLWKYTVGLLFSLRSRVSTHPVYYAEDLVKHYQIGNLKNISLNDLKGFTPFPEQFSKAIKWLQTKIEDKNPFAINVKFIPTKLQEELLFIIESIDPEKPIELFDENMEGLTEQEIERLKKKNAAIRNYNKKIE